MPTIKEPLRPYTEFKELKKPAVVKDLTDRANLYVEKAKIETKIENLNARLYPIVRKALPENLKSFEFNGFLVSAYQGEPQERFDPKGLEEEPVQCPHCKRKFTLPSSFLKKFRKLTKPPKPTFKVSHVRSTNGEEE